MDYQEFIKNKEIDIMPKGISDIDLTPKNEMSLKDFQRDIVAWALKLGNAAIFADCGMGKTPMQLYWADNIARHTGKPVLILCPLAVANQTIREGVKFGITVHSAYSATEDSIQITNYEKLEHFENEIKSGYYSGLVLDESSILKNFSGKIRQYIQDISRKIPYKLCCSATPCPNDFMEIGTHSEFLGHKKRVEMLAEFFVHDSGDTQKWRIKGHAEEPFWKWMASWSVAIRKPSDLGFDDSEFILPELLVKNQVVKSEKSSGMLFFKPAETLLERRQAKRDSLDDRCYDASYLANETDDSMVIWCNLNNESALLKKLIPDAIEVAGHHTNEQKIDAFEGFVSGKYRVLITKPSIGGFGMNWQHCHRMIFVGLSDSFEQYYQAVRRCWRFGQKKDVEVTIITSEAEGNILENIKNKQMNNDSMFESLVQHMSIYGLAKEKRRITYYPSQNIIIPMFLKGA